MKRRWPAIRFRWLSDSWGGENFTIQRPDNNAKTVPVQGWFTYDKAAELCKAAGLDLAKLKQDALQKDFQACHAAGREGQLPHREYAAQDRIA